jgi:hypothetical protein
MSGHPRHLTSTLTVESIGPVDISTIDLSCHGVRFLTGCETCLFWGRCESVVVEGYATWDEAVQGHAEWNSAEKVAHALHVLYRDRINH